MPMGTGSPAKEATILSLNQDIRKLLGNFQERLDNYFNRNLGVVVGKSEAPLNSNVLDEIIEELKVNKTRLSSIISFITSEVLPKIN